MRGSLGLGLVLLLLRGTHGWHELLLRRQGSRGLFGVMPPASRAAVAPGRPVWRRADIRLEETSEEPPSTPAATDIGYDLWWVSNSTEVVEPLRLEVSGSLPSWLRGSLVRAGPGLFEVGGQQLVHQIDGLAKLTKFQLDGLGGVNFQTRQLATKLFNRTQRSGELPAHFTILPVKPPYGLLQRLKALFHDSQCDNTNIFIWRTGSAAPYVCSDSSIQTNSFDPETLASMGHSPVMHAPEPPPGASGLPPSFTRWQRHSGTMTGAHRQRVIKGTATIGWEGRLELRQDKIELSTTVVSLYRDTPTAEDPRVAHRSFFGQVKLKLTEHGLPMIHSFQVTRRYVILVVCSLCVEPRLVGSQLFTLSDPFAGIDTLGWRGDQNATIYVLDIEATDPTAKPLRTFSIDPMYMNHHINAWEEEDGGVITLDLIAYAEPEADHRIPVCPHVPGAHIRRSQLLASYLHPPHKRPARILLFGILYRASSSSALSFHSRCIHVTRSGSARNGPGL
jgi:hypothetical protein